MAEQANGADVDLKIAGQEVTLRNVKSLNTIATVVTMFLSGLIIYILFTHQQDTKDAGNAFIAALKEQTIAIREGTAAQREQTCMLKFEQNERKINSDWCKQVAGVGR